jgi:O-antigen/teichoic acid export membrane protein
VSVLTGLAITILVTRLLTPKEVGAFFLAASIASFLAVTSQFGVNQVAIRYIAEAEVKGDINYAASIAKTIFFFSLICGTITYSIYLFGVRSALDSFIPNSHEILKLSFITGCWFFLQGIQITSSDIYRGFNHINNATLYGGTLSGVFCVGILGLELLSGKSIDAQSVIFVCIISIFLSLAISLYNLFPLMAKGSTNLTLKGVGKISAAAWPIWLNNISVFALTQANTWIVGAFQSSEEVALYGAAARAAGIFAFTSTVLYAVLPPTIAALYAKNEKAELEKILRRAATINTALMLPVFLIAIFAAPALLSFLFGQRYEAASELFVVLSLGHLINLSTGIRGYVLLMSGYQKIQLWISVAGGILSLILGYVGMLIGGTLYSAIGVTLAIAVQCIAELVAVKINIGIYTHFNLHIILNITKEIFKVKTC